MQTRMLINGELVQGEGAPIAVLNPEAFCHEIAGPAVRHVMIAHG